MATVTISRQMGSLGCEVAQITATRLHFHLVWRDLINQAARLAGAPEMALAAIDELGLLNVCPSPKICQAYRQAVRQIMEELADKGDVVIVGRAGQVILGARPNVLHVRIIAPFHLRVERIAQQQGISSECAQAQVETSDRYRARYLQRFYRVRWDNPELYHLVINTGLMSVDQAASVIYRAISEFTEAIHSPSPIQSDLP